MTMGDDSNGRPPFKTRSSSISAPGSSSLETINQPSDTPENGTPKNRRKPATRTQSARVPGGRSVCIFLKNFYLNPSTLFYYYQNYSKFEKKFNKPNKICRIQSHIYILVNHV